MVGQYLYLLHYYSMHGIKPITLLRADRKTKAWAPSHAAGTLDGVVETIAWVRRARLTRPPMRGRLSESLYSLDLDLTLPRLRVCDTIDMCVYRARRARKGGATVQQASACASALRC